MEAVTGLESKSITRMLCDLYVNSVSAKSSGMEQKVTKFDDENSKNQTYQLAIILSNVPVLYKP